MIHLEKKKRTEDCYQQSTMRFLAKDIYNIPKFPLDYYSISFLRGQINVSINSFCRSYIEQEGAIYVTN